MYGSRQHASHQAVGTDGQLNTNHQDSALASGLMAPPDRCPGLVCPASSQPRANAEGAVGQHRSHSVLIAIPSEMYNLPIQALGLSPRLFLCVQRAGIQTVGELLEMNLEALHLVKLGEKSIQELVQRVLALNLLDPLHQDRAEEPPEAAPAGRRDNRRRPGRGKLRHQAPPQAQPQELRISSSALFGPCYKVPVARLPLALRVTLPRWARCGIEQAEDNQFSREELPRRTRYCYVQPLTRGETGELTEWWPEPASGAPSHYRVAGTSDALRAASFIEVDEQEAQALVRELVNAAVPSPLIRVAPAFFLTQEMRAMIAPAIAFPDEFTVKNAAHTRVSLRQGNQVAIPKPVALMGIEHLSLSVKTHSCLQRAGITTVGALLELEEERLGTILNRESLWELYTAVFAKEVLPTPTGRIPAEQSDEGLSPRPVYENFFYYPTGTTYDDEERGRLYLVYAALFVDRLDGSRSGPVETLWLTRAQIGQSLIWERELERLDALSLQMRVTNHAVARGAVLPCVIPPDEAARERTRWAYELEEQYNLVRLRSELFVSSEDLDEADRQGEPPVKTALRVLERYQEHPEEQPVAYRLCAEQLQEMHHWIKRDRKRQFSELPHPAYPTIIERPVIVQRMQKIRQGQAVLESVPELIGYSFIIGLLATTPVPGELIVKPRLGKPTFQAPKRPIEPRRTPNYVPLAIVA